jgi:HEAT repeat protein
MPNRLRALLIAPMLIAPALAQNPPATRPAAQPYRVTTNSSDPVVQENYEQINRAQRMTRRGVIDPETRAMFVAIEKIARAAPEVQALQIPNLYRQVINRQMLGPNVERGLMALPRNVMNRDNVWLQPDDDIAKLYNDQLDQQAAAGQAPEDVADQIVANYHAQMLEIASRRRAMHVLFQHYEVLQPLIAADFASGDAEATKRALSLVGAMELTDFASQIIKLLMNEGPLTSYASQALNQFKPEPALIRPILDDLAQNPGAARRYQSVIRSMLAGKSPDAAVLRLLDSTDADVRAAAAGALEWIDRDASLEVIPTLIADADERVRLTGLELTLRLLDEPFAGVRPLVLAALKAPGIRERCRAAYILAAKRDPAGAKVLLECAKDPDLPQDLRSSVANATKSLMKLGNEPFWFSPTQWGPQVPQNARAIERFEKWMKENVHE